MTTLEEEARYMALKLAVSALMTPEAIAKLKSARDRPDYVETDADFDMAVREYLSDLITEFEGRA